MTTLTITAKGQVTFRQELLRHLGVEPGQKISVETLPDGRAIIQATQRGHDIDRAFGILKPRNTRNIVLSLEEMDEIAHKGWAKGNAEDT
ncbi:MAG: AbrB/MazE/SpoVT family DNA-binding domain-containing protein [Lautropia sp.]|nr:AbrB/MazE/SpoVT family DNA-binding domain-containing protein [Lautropia sp.]